MVLKATQHFPPDIVVQYIDVFPLPVRQQLKSGELGLCLYSHSCLQRLLWLAGGWGRCCQQGIFTMFTCRCLGGDWTKNATHEII